MSQSKSSALNEFVKGIVWGFVAFVHVAAVAVVIYKFKLNCLPESIVAKLSCMPPDSAKCASGCDPSNDLLFYILAGGMGLALVMLPLGFGIMFAVKARERAAR